MKTNNPIFRQKLTKKFFMGLGSGLYLTSNVCYGPGQPIYSAYVSQKENRQKQWADIKEARVDQGLCDVYRSEADWKTATEDFYVQ